MYAKVRPIFRTGLQSLTILVLVFVQLSFIGTSTAAAGSEPAGRHYDGPPPPGQTGEPGTPMQESLKKALDERTAQGLPVPASVSYEYEISTDNGQAGPRAMATATAGSVVKVTSRTTLYFENPQQAGYDKWPDFIVEGEVPQGGYGSIKPGNYNQVVHDTLAEQVPGIWNSYEFGYEPRTYTFEETYAGSYGVQDAKLFEQLSNGAADSTAVKEILLGFTVTGPHLDYTIDWSLDILGATVIDFLAGFAFDYGLGLRLPMEAGLTTPDAVPEGSSFSPTTYLAGLDWDAADFQAAGLAPENGNEFVMRFTFVLGVFLEVFGASVIDIGFNVDEDESSSFQTPFGTGSTFPLPALNVSLWDKDLGVASIAIGFSATPNLGSDRVTANWQATGDTSASGQITYTAPLSPISLGPLNAVDGPSQTDIQIDGFRYYFTQFLIELGAYISLDVFGLGGDTWTIPIVSFDLSDLTGDLYVGVHSGTSGTLTNSTTIQNVPPTAVIDRTGTVLIGGIQTFVAHTGEPLTFTGTSTDPGRDDLSLSWDWGDGPPSPDTTTLYPVPYSVTETQTHSFTGGCLYEVTFSAMDDDGGYGADQVPVLITAADGKVRFEGYWQHQYSGKGKLDFDTTALNCYLAVAAHMSSVFPEVEDASSIKAAHEVLFMKNHHGSVIDKFDRELLVVWLNLANGAIAYDDMVDTNYDGTGDTAVYDVVLAAEQLRQNPAATRIQILKQTQLLHLIYFRVK